ncbi:DUF3558 domain-containing protein [Rhodococcus triatomae]|uniref:DUF3558 domain-containing protein n=1 Tax=Rhodococcus triatomae TaxID=300028 RepID=A0A1G8JGJ1_9NOCA|nr:DUF3558 domain-containing protein [Rhodococcus triatomae]QNG19721.1 DUF3558 domain-containing protein [Rhodococcus triatomae]QNG24363.1 DUF3558 domain-containing protein [Rhodococcus triatomae]SDI30399.1 Protein of unknown function [Rhodococcus triatomae]
MTGRRSGVRVAGALALAAVAVASCGRSVEGTPVAEGAYAGNPEQFTDLLQECNAVAEDQIAETVGADAIERGFLGAICRWDAIGVNGTVKVTFHWFETGTLDTERETAEQLGYEVENATVQGRRAVLLRPPADPGSCGIALGSPSVGVVGWWVQYGGGAADPCAAAMKLADLTVDLSS